MTTGELGLEARSCENPNRNKKQTSEKYFI